MLWSMFSTMEGQASRKTIPRIAEELSRGGASARATGAGAL